MHRLTRLPRVIQPLSGSRYRFGIAQVCAVRTYATPAKPPSPNDAFANGGNSYYIDEMYRLWREDPKVVHASWNAYFSGMEKGLPSYKAFTPPPSFEATGIATLNLTGNKDLDIHLKVRKHFGLVLRSQASLLFGGKRYLGERCVSQGREWPICTPVPLRDSSSLQPLEAWRPLCCTSLLYKNSAEIYA